MDLRRKAVERASQYLAETEIENSMRPGPPTHRSRRETDLERFEKWPLLDRRT